MNGRYKKGTRGHFKGENAGTQILSQEQNREGEGKATELKMHR